MRLAVRPFLLAAAMILAAGPLHAAAPSSKEYMQPVDTSPGSISDPRKLFKVDLEKSLKVSVSGAPLSMAFNQVNAILGIEFGYGEGITPKTPVTVNVTGKGKDVLKQLGVAAGIRFEANGPLQLKVVRARQKEPTKPAPPPKP